jgi:very-short-patch-repair endonuclease
LAALAERQHGVIARWQVLSWAGEDEGRRRRLARHLERRLAASRLHIVHRGVYAVGHRRLTQHGRFMAAVLAAGPGAVLSHSSAAALWSLLPPRSTAIEVSRRTAARRRSRIEIHATPIPRDERSVVGGIPVTSAARTILDLAGCASGRRRPPTRVSRHEVERAVNQMEVLGLRDTLGVPELLRRYPRRPGSALLRNLLADPERASGVTATDLEDVFLGLVGRSRLPPPRINADLALGGRFIRPDFMWPDRRLIVETDGRGAHGPWRAVERDHERDRLLLAGGWRVMRVTWRQLHDTPQDVARDLRRALTEKPP